MFDARPGHCIVFLGKTLNTLYPRTYAKMVTRSDERWVYSWATLAAGFRVYLIVHLPFYLTVFSHVTQSILLCRQWQLFRASPKKQSTCFSSKGYLKKSYLIRTDLFAIKLNVNYSVHP